MPIFEIKKTDVIVRNENGKLVTVVKKNAVDSFNEDILGLGKIETKSIQKSALSVIFDLEGFTNFCKQIDPQLEVPEYLSEFLSWIFSQIRKEVISKTYADGYGLYSSLPFLSKYLGDGLLFLWDTEHMDDTEMLNIIISMSEICDKYVSEFLPTITNKLTSPPTMLRCGIARGIIYSVGNGNDFVGPCINMSARLQKLNSLPFCFSRRGLNPEKFEEVTRKLFVTKKVDIRGIGSEELICCFKKEFEKLLPEDKSKFKSV